MKLLRPLAAAAAALLLVLAGAALGLLVSARYAPDRLAAWTEELLAERLGPVRVGSVHPTFAWGPAVEVRGLRTLPEASGAALAARSLRVGFDLRGLFRGDLRPARIELSGVRGTLVRGADGAIAPAAIGRLLAGERRAEEPADPFGPLGALRRLVATLPAIALEDAAIGWRDGAAPAGAPLADVAVHGLRATLRQGALLGGRSLVAGGRLVIAGADRGGFELDVELPAFGAPHAELALTRLDAALLTPWLARWESAREAELALAGQLGAHVTWRAEEERAERIELELIGLDLRAAARPDGAGDPQEVSLPSAHFSGTLVLRARQVRLERAVAALGPLRFQANARVRLPFTDESRVDLSVRGAPLAHDTVRDWLLASGAPSLERAADALVAGQLGSWSLRCAGTTRASWRAAIADPIGAWPGACRLELAVEELGVRLGDGPPLRALSGRLVYGHDRLELHEVRGRLGEDPLPTLDATVSGVAAVLAALAEGELPAPVPPLPGWYVLEDWARGDRKPGAPARWQRAEISASRIAHPALLRPVSGLRAVLRPAPFGWDAEISDGWWGTARISGRARKSGEPPGHIVIDATARGDAGRPPRDPADPEAWLRAHFAVELTSLGPFRARGVSGRVRIEGDRGEITEGDAELVPRGRLVGEVDVGLAQRDHVPASGRLRLEGGSLPDLLADLHLDPSVMTGTVHLSGDVSARLVPRGNILRELTGPVTMKLRDGVIHERMNLLLAIAAASDTFNPFRSRDVLPYDEIDGLLALERGFVRGESLSLVGPAARLVANGRVDVVDAPYALEAVVGVYFFKTIDTVISKVPLVNRLLLGKDDNLLAAWFALTGPWADPSARLLPQTLFTSGPMGIVTEGVPGFVRSGVETLARLLDGGAAADERAREAARRPRAPEREARP